MAFALVDANFGKLEIPTAIKKRGLQYIEMKITRGAAGDTDLDIGDLSGTFWANAIANGTYGTQATLAKKEYEKIAAAVDGVISLDIIANTGPMLRVASTSGATNYDLSNGGTYPLVKPVITFTSNAAPATISVRLVLSLTDETNTVDFSY